MKVKLSTLKAGESSLNKLFNSDKLDIVTAYKLSKVAKIVTDELSKVEEFRTKLVLKYGEEKDGNFMVKPENLEKFLNEMEALLSQEIDIDFQIELEKVPEGFTAKELSEISFLIKEVENGNNESS